MARKEFVINGKQRAAFVEVLSYGEIIGRSATCDRMARKAWLLSGLKWRNGTYITTYTLTSAGANVARHLGIGGGA